jgi:hypothetical protein
MSISVSIGTQIPTNVVEVGNEITSDQLAAITSASTPTSANPFVTTSALPAAGVSSDKALANAIAVSIWYTYDTGSDWNRSTGITNTKILAGDVLSCGVNDGTDFITGFPAILTSVHYNQDWKVSVNGVLSDFPIMNQIV